MAVLAGYDVVVVVASSTGSGPQVLAAQRNVTFSREITLNNISDKSSMDSKWQPNSPLGVTRFSVEALYDIDESNARSLYNYSYDAHIRNDPGDVNNLATADEPHHSQNSNMYVWRRDTRSGSMEKVERARARFESITESFPSEDVGVYTMNFVLVNAHNSTFEEGIWIAV